MTSRGRAAILSAALVLPLSASGEEAKPAARVPVSPRAAEEIAVGTGKIRIEYSRPFVKGRKIFGALVPWNTVWRTGANAATSLLTDVDITLGDTLVPKGSYTLYTLPGEKAWKLIVSKETGQWGTEYDPKMDLARIEMKASHRSEPTEAFTISLVPEDPWKGTLRLAWDRLVLSVPYAAKR